MRKYISLIIAVCLVLSMSSVAFASDLVSTHAPDLNDPSRLEEIEQLKLRVEEAGYNEDSRSNSASARIAYPIIEDCRLNVPLYQQDDEYYYYCGPMSGKMVLDYLLSSNISVDGIARAMETNTSGTYVYKLTNGLNSYLSANPYHYVLTSELSFVAGMKQSINNNFPVVCHVQTSALPIYNGYTSGHYVVATGYFISQYNANAADDERTVYYNDPNYKDQYYGRHTCTTSEMINAINSNAGFYIMGG